MNDNITPPDGYRHTGTSYPINPDILQEYVTQQLAIYDQGTKDGNPDDFSPYRDPILYQTEDGKVVQIPQDVQVKAINEWLQQKQQLQNPHPIPDEVQQRDPNLMPRQHPYNMNNVYEPMENYQEEYEEEGLSRNKMILIGLLVAAGGYFYYKKYRK